MSDDQNDSIADGPSHKKLREQMDGMAALGKAVRFFERLGIKHKKMSEAFSKFDELQEKTRHLMDLPDRFNRHFASRGWVAHELLNVELAKKVVELADAGRVEEAEDLLVGQWEGEELPKMMKFLFAFPDYLERERLIDLAIVDYQAGRYHASIPVVLMMIDGIVSDVAQTGFFAEGTDVTAWDSIAGHSTGLRVLKDMMNANRKKTSAEPIYVPYRHGILHGRDLAYDNKILAAKCWSALLAIRGWYVSKRDEQKRRAKMEEKSKVKLTDTLKELAESKVRSARFESWKPRTVRVGSTIPAFGRPDDYPQGSPEQLVARFLSSWQAGNFGVVAECIKLFDEQGINHAAGRIKKGLKALSIKTWSIESVTDEYPHVGVVVVAVELEREGVLMSRRVTFRACFEDRDGEFAAFGLEEGVWKIMERQIWDISRGEFDGDSTT